MKKTVILLSFLVTIVIAKAQKTATFDDLKMPADSFWNGSDGSGKFVSGIFTFHNSYSKEWGSWSGFAYSCKTDRTTPGYTNQFSAVTGKGVFNSTNYALGYEFGILKATLSGPDSVTGIFITNSTYTYLTLLNGDAFTDKFGGTTGMDPDYFRIRISGLNSGGDTTGTVTFYLADFRSADSREDYIVRDWTWVDLSSLGIVSELRFSLESSDVGAWGMNTPAYFCLDNLNHRGMGTVEIRRVSHSSLKVYPNPFHDQFSVELPGPVISLSAYDLNGRLLYGNQRSGKGITLITALKDSPPGIYFLRIKGKETSENIKLIKK